MMPPWLPTFGLLWREKFLDNVHCSDTKSCRTLCNPMDCSTAGSPVLHYLPECAQIHGHWGRNVIQPSHPLSLPFSSCSQSSQHPDPSQWVGSLHLVVKVLELLNVTYYFMTQFESFCMSRKRAILMLNC